MTTWFAGTSPPMPRTTCGFTDITEHPTAEGRLYLCAIKDTFSNRIVGYSIDERMKARLAVQAIDNAAARREDIAGCI
jgi:putative transposase